jgi:hypothetical protein
LKGNGTPVTFGEAFGSTRSLAVGEDNPLILPDCTDRIQGGVFNDSGADIVFANENESTILRSSTELEFCIPIYSGIIGVLMPTKKLIPMSLLPLEIEFTMNPHAFYPVGTDSSRRYTVKRFEIWTHTMFFE